MQKSYDKRIVTMSTTGSDALALLAVMGMFVGLLAIRPKETKENFAGMNYPMKYKVSREIVHPHPGTCTTPQVVCRCGAMYDDDECTCGATSAAVIAAQTGGGMHNYAVSGNYQTSLQQAVDSVKCHSDPPPVCARPCPPPPRHGVTIDPYHPISDRHMISEYVTGNPVVNDDHIYGPVPKKCIRTSAPASSGCVDSCEAPVQVCDRQDTGFCALPVSDMRSIQTCVVDTDDGLVPNPIVYDRLIYANARSRLRGGSDWIRGDLPIVPVLPQCDPNSLVWGRPSVTPHIDLNQGAMHVLGGFDNCTQQKLQKLMEASSSGTLGTFSGIRVEDTVVDPCTTDVHVLSTH